jgi:RNA polymerase sporulation-specific sigma factor
LAGIGGVRGEPAGVSRSAKCGVACPRSSMNVEAMRMAAHNLASLGPPRLLADEEVVAQAKKGSLWATEHILRKYRHLVEGKAKAYFLVGADHEDVVQEGMIGLFKAIRDFSGENLAAFRSFADLCVTRQIITAVKTATRYKHSLLNTSISVELAAADQDDEPAWRELLIEDRPSDPQELFLSREFRNEVDGCIREVLSPLEAEALRRYIEGKSYQDIARELRCGVKQVDNALQRAKRKMGRSLAAIPA